MQYNVAQLLKEQTGAVRRYELKEDLSDLDPDLEFLGPLVGTLQLLRTNSGILATGELSTAILVVCNRCIEPIAMQVRFDLEEMFHPSTEVFTGRALSEDEFEGDKDEWDDSALTIDEHHILDIKEVLRQNIWTAMPMYPGCNWIGSGECPNLTAHIKSLEGVRLIVEDKVSEEMQPENIDPRWAALLEIQKKQSEGLSQNNADDRSSAKRN